MVEKILNELNIKNHEVRFVQPPQETYAIWFDSYSSRGSDDENLIHEHSYRIEIYSGVPDKQVEKKLENKLDAMAIEYSKQDRYWIESEQLYQVIYEFDYIEK